MLQIHFLPGRVSAYAYVGWGPPATFLTLTSPGRDGLGVGFGGCLWTPSLCPTQSLTGHPESLRGAFVLRLLEESSTG